MLGNLQRTALVLLAVLYQHHDVAVLVCRSGSAVGHLAGLIDREGGLCSDLISFRSYGLFQGVGNARLQTHHFMNYLGGIPLNNYISILIQNLDVCAFQLFAGIDVNLAHAYLSSCILYQKDGVAVLVGGGGSAVGHLAGLIDREGGFGGNGVSIRSYSLFQRVGLARLQAGHHMSFVCGIPLLNYIAILIQDLDMCAF